MVAFTGVFVLDQYGRHRLPQRLVIYWSVLKFYEPGMQETAPFLLFSNMAISDSFLNNFAYKRQCNVTTNNSRRSASLWTMWGSYSKAQKEVLAGRRYDCIYKQVWGDQITNRLIWKRTSVRISRLLWCLIVDAEIGQREGATIAASNSMLRQLEVILPPTWGPYHMDLCAWTFCSFDKLIANQG